MIIIHSSGQGNGQLTALWTLLLTLLPGKHRSKHRGKGGGVKHQLRLRPQRQARPLLFLYTDLTEQRTQKKEVCALWWIRTGVTVGILKCYPVPAHLIWSYWQSNADRTIYQENCSLSQQFYISLDLCKDLNCLQTSNPDAELTVESG